MGKEKSEREMTECWCALLNLHATLLLWGWGGGKKRKGEGVTKQRGRRVGPASFFGRVGKEEKEGEKRGRGFRQKKRREIKRRSDVHACFLPNRNSAKKRKSGGGKKKKGKR